MGARAYGPGCKVNIRIMKRFVFASVLVGSVVAPIAIARRANVRLQETSGVLRDESGKLTELAASNEQLRKQLADAEAASLTSEERSEMLRLRNEIGRLRRAVDEVDKLRSNNSALATCGQTNLAADAYGPDPASIHAHWPKAQLEFSGYADPLAALQSALWAMSHGDPNSLMGSVTR